MLFIFRLSLSKGETNTLCLPTKEEIKFISNQQRKLYFWALKILSNVYGYLDNASQENIVSL